MSARRAVVCGAGSIIFAWFGVSGGGIFLLTWVRFWFSVKEVLRRSVIFRLRKKTLEIGLFL